MFQALKRRVEPRFGDRSAISTAKLPETDLIHFDKMSVILRRLVHNEAMREDPKEIYGWRVYMLACSVGFL